MTDQNMDFSSDQERVAATEAVRRFASGLAETQWMSLDELAAMQHILLERLARHAIVTAPFYSTRLASLFTRRGEFNIGGLQKIPPMTRVDIVENSKSILSNNVPWQVGRTVMAETSGSTGEPLTITSCALQKIANVGAATRTMEWHGVDFTQNLAAIRIYHGDGTEYPHGDMSGSKWGPYWRDDIKHGTRVRLSINTPAHLQLEWLGRVGNCYLNTMPTNVVALAEAASRAPELKPRVAKILALGEMVTQDSRDMAREHLGTTMLDQYSTVECGVIAGECASHGNLHIQSEMVIVEALRPDGSNCAIGEEGLACITVLNSYAMPLIRYLMTDLITLLPPCGCGRGLPKMKVTGGRIRNRFRFADGSFMAPAFGAASYRTLLGATRFQCAQIKLDELEIRFVSDWAEDAIQYHAMRESIRHKMNQDINVSFKRVEYLPLGRSGKHFDYVNEMKDP